MSALTPTAYAAGPWTRRDLFRGQGEVKVWDLIGQREAGAFKAALWCELEAGGRVGGHVQEVCPELVVCLGGRGEAWVGEVCHSLAPGGCVYLPLGATLRLCASGEGPLFYLILKVSGLAEGGSSG